MELSKRSLNFFLFASNTKEKIDFFLEFLNTKIKFGFIDKNNKIYTEEEINSPKWFSDYTLQRKDRLLKTLIGHCWDFVELERWFFNKNKIKTETYFICDEDLIYTHTFLIYFLNNKVYWMESAWYKQKGIYEFNSKEKCLDHIKSLCSKEQNKKVKLYEYKEPTFDMDQKDFMEHCLDKELEITFKIK